jgi:hypothetical protein
MTATAIDVTGKRFGRLVVLRRAKSRKPPRGAKYRSRLASWHCCCDCGKEVVVVGVHLRNGATKSCGCARVKPDRALNSVFATYTRRARNRGLRFRLTKKQFTKLALSDCFYCGAAPRVTATSARSKVRQKVNGIDRLDSSKGYEVQNCVPCCSVCNRAKGTMTKEEFLKWIQSVWAYSKERNSDGLER